MNCLWFCCAVYVWAAAIAVWYPLLPVPLAVWVHHILIPCKLVHVIDLFCCDFPATGSPFHLLLSPLSLAVLEPIYIQTGPLSPASLSSLSRDADMHFVSHQQQRPI
ncbi:hypothetical protein XELAEV_18014282mg [Xenopus laevis]|uniref:Uncharacterized protein n=1 Tax=Xenopus laevis TaxID=8355 RepID=A0A974HUV5_XENLA|nr:hypothetical protein XELAEV_18014282mg [Xenopus laevis]